MALRILAYFALLASASAGGNHGWYFFPANTQYKGDTRAVSGLQFHFEAAPSDKVTVSARVRDCGKERTVSATIDTDHTQGSALLSFPIGSLDGFEVESIQVQFPQSGNSIEKPRAATTYPYHSDVSETR